MARTNESSFRRAWADTNEFRTSGLWFWVIDVAGALVFLWLGALVTPSNSGTTANTMYPAFAVGALLQNADLGHVPWAVSRASGLAAFVVLSVSMVLGLLVRTKIAESAMPRPLTFDLHQFLSVLGLVLIGLHGSALLFDGYFQFTPQALLIPFVSPYAPFWVGLGVMSGWMTMAVSASFWVKKRIGHSVWRRLHYLAFATYVLALVHGIGAASDSATPAIYWMYGVSAAAVASLAVYRMAAPHGSAPAIAGRTATPRGRLDAPPLRAMGKSAGSTSFLKRDRGRRGERSVFGRPSLR